jgi:hypothetical protein
MCLRSRSDFDVASTSVVLERSETKAPEYRRTPKALAF